VTRVPLLLPALAFIGAVAAEAHGWGLLALAVAGLALADRRAHRCAAFGIAGLVAATCLGHPPIVTEESHTMRFAGTITGDVRRDEGGGMTFPFALDAGIVVRAALHHDGAVPGDRLVLRGRVVPFDEARNPGEPSRRAIALAEGLAGELIADRVVARAPPDPHDARTWAAWLRAALSARLRSVLHEPEASVVAGALWGERATLPEELREQFQATGTVHVLVTAGLHLGVIAWLVAGVLLRCRLSRVPASLAAIPFVIAYAWLSGAHLPSQRAATMLSIALLARALGARLISWNALALAALVVAALWPAAVTSVSFALSFSCVGAILLFADPISRAIERWRLPERVREALALTIATQLGVWPLSAATFGLVAPYAVLANAIVVPATAGAMVAGITALVCAQLPVLDRTAATIATWNVDAILRVVGAVASLPGAQFRVAPPPAIAIIAYDAIAIAGAAVLRRNARLCAIQLVLASAIVFVSTMRLPDGRLTVTMLDVGQGDGIVIRTPRGHTILVDTGGRLERGPSAAGKSPAEIAGERIVLGYLLRQGIRRIDLLVITHPHGDHVGGCRSIVETMPVLTVLDSGQPYGGRAYRDCIDSARARGVPIVIGRRGMQWSSDDGVSLDVLAPSLPFLGDTGDDVNENSIVVMLRYDGFRELFMGDAGEAAEARLLASGVDVHADVVKVGHHGSAYASTPAFAARVHPALALISVGRHNTFGHPAPATIATWERLGAHVLRTDRCGSVTLHVGAGYVTTMLPCH
jgi:competence protein ComEC